MAAHGLPQRQVEPLFRCRSPSARLAGDKLKKGDIVIAPKLDRLFRSALDALQVVEDLKKRGVSLHLLDLGGSRPFRL